MRPSSSLLRTTSAALLGASLLVGGIGVAAAVDRTGRDGGSEPAAVATTDAVRGAALGGPVPGSLDGIPTTAAGPTTTTTNPPTTAPTAVPPATTAPPTTTPPTTPSPTTPAPTTPAPTTTAPPTTAPPTTTAPEAPPSRSASSTEGRDTACESDLLAWANDARRAQGTHPLAEDEAIQHVSVDWAARMARTGELAHNPDYAAQVFAVRPEAGRVGENVGYASDAPRSVFDAFMGSPGHRDKLLGERFAHVTVGCVRDAAGWWWVSVEFWG